MKEKAQGKALLPCLLNEAYFILCIIYDIYVSILEPDMIGIDDYEEDIDVLQHSNIWQIIQYFCGTNAFKVFLCILLISGVLCLLLYKGYQWARVLLLSALVIYTLFYIIIAYIGVQTTEILFISLIFTGLSVSYFIYLIRSKTVNDLIQMRDLKKSDEWLLSVNRKKGAVIFIISILISVIDITLLGIALAYAKNFILLILSILLYLFWMYRYYCGYPSSRIILSCILIIVSIFWFLLGIENFSISEIELEDCVYFGITLFHFVLSLLLIISKSFLAFMFWKRINR